MGLHRVPRLGKSWTAAVCGRVTPTRTGLLRKVMTWRLGTSRLTLGLGNEGKREPEIEGWKESWTQELSGMLKKCLGPNGGTPTGGSTCRWEENDAPTVDRSPRVGMVNLEHVRIGGEKMGPWMGPSGNTL